MKETAKPARDRFRETTDPVSTDCEPAPAKAKLRDTELTEGGQLCDSGEPVRARPEIERKWPPRRSNIAFIARAVTRYCKRKSADFRDLATARLLRGRSKDTSAHVMVDLADALTLTSLHAFPETWFDVYK